MPMIEDDAQTIGVEENAQAIQPKKKPARKNAANKKVSRGKASAKTAATAADGLRKFEFPGLSEAIALAEKTLTESEKLLESLEGGVTRAITKLHKAEEALVVRRMAAREKGSAGAKNALAKARETKHKAAAELKTTKADYRAARAGHADAGAAIKRLLRAEQRLVKTAVQAEVRLAKRIATEEKKILSAVFAPPKKRKPRRKKLADVPAAAVESAGEVVAE